MLGSPGVNSRRHVSNDRSDETSWRFNLPIATINPATGQTLETFNAHTAEDVEARIARGARVFRSWRKTPFEDRSRLMFAAAEILESDAERLGELMTTEMGKTIGSARAEAKKCAWVCRYYAENAEAFLADRVVETDAKRSWVRYQPLGIVLAIMPWNFPFWQVFRFAAPGLMAGNVGLLKHASNVPRCALAIEDIFRRAGFPEGAFQTLLVGSSVVPSLIEDDRIAAATLTGSEPAGRDVASRAGREIKKVVLELGGSDPFIVMPSADLDVAVKTAVTARMINNGQSCIAAKRFIVHEQIADAFLEQFTAAVGALVVGDPMDEKTDIGPLATRAIRDEVAAQVDATKAKGGRIAIGGEIVEGPGYFYAPTVLTDIPDESPASRDELFGPVASVFRARDIDHAIAIANSTSFGLGASAWTKDEAEERRFVDEIEAGAVFINAMVASNPHLPFGGIKRSGFGRELAEEGIREFVNVKTVWVA